MVSSGWHLSRNLWTKSNQFLGLKIYIKPIQIPHLLKTKTHVPWEYINISCLYQPALFSRRFVHMFSLFQGYASLLECNFKNVLILDLHKMLGSSSKTSIPNGGSSESPSKIPKKTKTDPSRYDLIHLRAFVTLPSVPQAARLVAPCGNYIRPSAENGWDAFVLRKACAKRSFSANPPNKKHQKKCGSSIFVSKKYVPNS